MAATHCVGLMFVLAAVAGQGRADSAILEEEISQVPSASENSLKLELPLYQLTSTPTQVVHSPERRLSLEDFFLNSNSQQGSQPAAQTQQQQQQQQAPLTQFQVQQPDPNSLFFVRDAQFPSPTGGVLSRMLMLRRMLRLRRIARRLTLVPRILGLGLGPQLRRAQLSAAQPEQQPLSIFNNRAGQAYPEPYDPRDYVFGPKAFSYSNNASTTKQGDSSADLQQQQTRNYPLEAEPYYDSLNDLPYDSYDNSKSVDSYESDELNNQRLRHQNYHSLRPNVANHLQVPVQSYGTSNQNDQQIQTLQLLQQLQNYQQLLQQNQNNHQSNAHNNQKSLQYEPPLQNQYEQQQRLMEQQKLYEQQLEKLREQQELILEEQRLRQQLLEELLLAQKNQNSQDSEEYKQSNSGSVQQQNHMYHHHDYQEPVRQPNLQTEDQDKNAGERNQNTGFVRGGSPGFSPNPNSIGVGVGVNVGIKPPAVDIQVSKPVGPIPPITNPIIHKPPPPPPVEEHLVPIGILPKPILNLKGRLFFGAELGKGVGVKAGAKR